MLLVDSASGMIHRGGGIARLLESSIGSGRAARRARVKPANRVAAPRTKDAKRIAAALGWTEDQFRLLFQPLGLEGKEAIWSMGDDAPPAFVSAARRPLWDYCKQRFAQVTNPAIDPLREAHVMSLEVHCGENVTLDSPVIDRGQVRRLEARLGQARRIDFTFDAARRSGRCVGRAGTHSL